MISALHLLWIIPCAAMWGFFSAVFVVAAGNARRQEEGEDE